MNTLPTPRRAFLRAALGAGLGASFAAAVSPVSAQTMIETSAEGLDVGTFEMNVGGTPIPLYAARPKASAKPPAVIVVVSEIFGVHAHIADVARRFAQMGYFAVAPEFFKRQGNPQTVSDIETLMRDIVGKTPDAQVLGDLQAALAWAVQQGGDASRVGVTGFCWGGRITWLAATLPQVRAGVAWYGRLEGTVTPNTPKYPVDLVAQLHAPVLGLYGGADQGIPLDSVEDMKAALAQGSAAAKASEFVIYPDAPHAFHADYRPSYREAAAKDGWKRCLEWFRTHGV